MRALVLAFTLCAFATPAAADRFALAFEGSALGVLPLGGITVDADVSEDSYRVTARSVPAACSICSSARTFALNAHGVIESGAVHWRRYDLDHHYSRKHRPST